MSYKGIYKVKNPLKYKGDFKNCVFRSLWERKFMKYCDDNKNVLFWSSEEVRIPYRSPLDGKIHYYFVDFWMRVKTKDGSVKTYLVEIKPEKQTKPPIIEENKKMTPSKVKQIKTYALNTEKWKAARNFSKEKGWEFLILTEKHLFGK
jgi:hypothetical protein